MWNTVEKPPAELLGVGLVTPGDNIGITAGRNLGAESGNEDIVLFLDDDAEVLTPAAASLIKDHFSRNPNCAVVALRIIDHQGITLRRHNPRVGTKRAEKPGPVGTFLGGACAIRRSVFLEIGGFDPTFGYSMEEQDLSWRLHKEGLSVHYRPDILVRHPHTDPSRHPQAIQRTWRNRIRAARKSLPLPVRVVHLTLHGARALLHGLQPRDLITGLTSGHESPADRDTHLSARQVWSLTRLGRPPIF